MLIGRNTLRGGAIDAAPRDNLVIFLRSASVPGNAIIRTTLQVVILAAALTAAALALMFYKVSVRFHLNPGRQKRILAA